jgi:hypothetical protein
MDDKSREINGSVVVPDSAIEAVYDKLKSDGKANKPYDQMYSQIKWSLVQLQETRAINNWLMSLYKKASIKINEAYISKKSENKAPVVPVPTKEIKDTSSAKDAKNTKEIKLNTGKK